MACLTMSYLMEASLSGIPSLTEELLGYKRWCIRRTLEECFHVTAPMGDAQKLLNGGELNSPHVCPLVTCAAMSEESDSMTEGSEDADVRLVQRWLIVQSLKKPRLAPKRIICCKEDTKQWSGYLHK